MPTKSATATPARNGKGEGVVLVGPASPSNDGALTIATLAPYAVRVELEGVCPILFHRWSDDDVAAKGAAAKGSAAKKTDNVEAYVYRVDPTNPKSDIGIPGEYLRGSAVNAAKFRQDPRSPRKSAMDLYKAGVVPLTTVATLGRPTWEFVDRRRATVQRSAITRSRPGFNAGWRATFDLQVNLPEYIVPNDLLDIINLAGRVIGLGDNRPTYGRFQVVGFAVL